MSSLSTLTQALQNNAACHAGSTAILDSETRWTWSEFITRVARAAGMLRQLGLDRGERYAILALNSWRQAELVYAGYWLGAVPVPVNFRLAAPEIRAILDDAGCRLLFLDQQFLPLLDSAALQPWQERHVCLSPGERQHPRHYDTLFGKALPLEPADIRADDEAILLYTGGTTGKAKGVPLTHNNILANARQVSSTWSAISNDVVLHVAPMFHSAELVKTIYLLNGAASAYLPAFSPQALLEAIETYRVSFVLMVPTIIMMVLESGILPSYDISSLRQIIYGASPMPVAWIKKTFESFPGVQIAQGYGLTETSPLLAMLDNASHLEALETGELKYLASCGRVLPGVDIRITSEQGKEMGVGEEGEIVARGENVFRGYLDMPELNAAVLDEDWFHTGDIGLIDEKGYLFLKDRKDDVIITGGEKVYSSEVEKVISQHPEVSECAVIGTEDKIYGERVHALVVRHSQSTLTGPCLIEYCRERIGGYKLPRAVDMVEQLPKSPMGKVLKTALREKYNALSSDQG